MPVSVIIPTLNEAAVVAQAIRAVRVLNPYEILVVDGGSADNTPAAAREADAVLSAPRGRATQMNAGAAQARGDVLVFLHADCSLEAGSLEAVEKALARPDVAAGCFRMEVLASGSLYRSINACASARVRLTGLVYGDQGLFVRRQLFERLAGFPSVRFLEDVLLSQGLRRQGRVVVVPRRIFVSPRRWQRAGLVRQSLRNWMLLTLAAAGADPDRLARFYPTVR